MQGSENIVKRVWFSIIFRLNAENPTFESFYFGSKENYMDSLTLYGSSESPPACFNGLFKSSICRYKTEFQPTLLVDFFFFF